MPTIEEFTQAMKPVALTDDTFSLPPLNYYGSGSTAQNAVSRMVFGGQLLAQAIVITGNSTPGQFVRSVSIDFVRSAVIDEDIIATVDVIKRGSAVSNIGVTFAQAGKVCAAASALCVTTDDDFLTLASSAPASGIPTDHGVSVTDFRGYERAFLEGGDVWDGSVGPPSTVLWARFPQGPHAGVIGQGLLSLVTVPFLVDVALRPFDGLNAALAHSQLSTAVLAHGITFHRPVDAGAWHVLDLVASSVAGGGGYGTGSVYDSEGTLVASFRQDMMVRGQQHVATGARSEGRRL